MRKTINVNILIIKLNREIQELKNDIRQLDLENRIEKSLITIKENENYINNLSKVIYGIEKSIDIINRMVN